MLSKVVLDANALCHILSNILAKTFYFISSISVVCLASVSPRDFENSRYLTCIYRTRIVQYSALVNMRVVFRADLFIYIIATKFEPQKTTDRIKFVDRGLHGPRAHERATELKSLQHA